jgi:hypothetical protein
MRWIVVQRAAPTTDEVTLMYSQASDRARWPTPNKQLAGQAARTSSPESAQNRIRLYKHASAAGALKTLQWLVDHVSSISLNGWRKDCGLPEAPQICAAAAGGGHLAVLQWLRANGCPWESDECAWGRGIVACVAAGSDRLAALQWARANGCPWDRKACSAAAGGGHLSVLQWARANGCEWDAGTCYEAIRGGHLGVLQWARVNGCEWNASTWDMMMAAAGGHLAVLQWLRANECPWSEHICHEAIRGGHLAVLQWARVNGCPWDRAACLTLAYNCHGASVAPRSEIHEWIQAQPA